MLASLSAHPIGSQERAHMHASALEAYHGPAPSPSEEHDSTPHRVPSPPQSLSPHHRPPRTVFDIDALARVAVHPEQTDASEFIKLLSTASHESSSQDGLFSQASHPKLRPSSTCRRVFRKRMVAMYKREVEDLQHKLLMTTAERDTVEVAFGALISVLKLPEETNPLSFSLVDVDVGLRASTSEKVWLSKEEYPGLHFWVWPDYDGFATSLEVQSMDRGKAPWLEQENGDPITADRLRAIRTSLWRSASGKGLVYKINTPPHDYRVNDRYLSPVPSPLNDTAASIAGLPSSHHAERRGCIASKKRSIEELGSYNVKVRH
ncbi:hypothetical protein EDD15DRAFT_2380572 [Pisolithus albus]|nr:hypothetical protein EDD15DRAFT_2380572 [Pisolithus albus]